MSAEPNNVKDAVIFTAATASIFVVGGLLAALSNATGANQVEPAPVAVETTPTVIDPVIETTEPIITPSPLVITPTATTPPVLVSPSPLVTPTNAPIDSVAPPVTPVPGAIATTTPAPTPTVDLSPTPDVTGTTSPLATETPALSPSPTATTPPLTPATPALSPTPTATTPPLTPATPALSPSPTAAPETSAQISDPAQIETLQQELYQQLDAGWQTFPTFQNNLVYRVSVTEDGAIAKYEPTNEAAEQYVQEIPLSTLVPGGASASSAAQGPVADYKVTFTPAGELQVSPW